MQYANRECNAVMTVAKRMNPAHPATIANIILACPPLGSLVVRLITGGDIGISGVGDHGVDIQSLVRCRTI